MTASTEIAPTTFTDADLKKIGSFDDALALIRTNGELQFAANILGNGFETVEKKKLIGVTFVIVTYRITDSKDYKDAEGNPAKFVVCYVVTQDGRKFYFSDGSTGICTHVLSLAEQGIESLAVPGGLRVSEYTTDAGETARTYYLSTNA